MHPDSFAGLAALQSWLEGLLQGLQPRLLRFKGIVGVAGDGMPWVVQAVAERLHAFERLPPGSAWAGRSFVIVIARDLSREELLAACAQTQPAAPSAGR